MASIADAVSGAPLVSGLSLQIAPGEILGLAGLVGAGRSEVAQAIFGLDSRSTGEVQVRGQRLRPRSVSAALEAGEPSVAQVISMRPL